MEEQEEPTADRHKEKPYMLDAAREKAPVIHASQRRGSQTGGGVYGRAA